jgi:hypothetical protein
MPYHSMPYGRHPLKGHKAILGVAAHRVGALGMSHYPLGYPMAYRPAEMGRRVANRHTTNTHASVFFLILNHQSSLAHLGHYARATRPFRHGLFPSPSRAILRGPLGALISLVLFLLSKRAIKTSSFVLTFLGRLFGPCVGLSGHLLGHLSGPSRTRLQLLSLLLFNYWLYIMI